MERLNTRILTALLSKDSKDATYKFALLRAMVQCVTEQRAHKQFAENVFADFSQVQIHDNLVHSTPQNKAILQNAPYVISYPMGLLIYYWVLYYYPIFAYRVFIPQKSGETPDLATGQTIAFRREFNRVIDFYRDKGGLGQFRYDLIHNSVPDDIRRQVLQLLRKVQKTIRNMPMKHLGFSIFQKSYSMVNSTTGKITNPAYSDLVRYSGRFMMHPELHDVLDELGTLIIGQDSIIFGWADFTHKMAQRSTPDSDISREEMISLLHQAVDIPRDVLQVKKVLEGERQNSLQCVWSGREIQRNLHIDHALPYSLWQNNNLWNLLPVAGQVNTRKRDRIPSPCLIDQSSDRIRKVWELYAGRYGNQFYRELYEGLATGRDDGFPAAIESFKHISAYLIDKRGYQMFEM